MDHVEEHRHAVAPLLLPDHDDLVLVEPQRGLTVPDDEARAPDEELRLGAPLEVRRDRQPRLARAPMMVPRIVLSARVPHALAPRLLFVVRVRVRELNI